MHEEDDIVAAELRALPAPQAPRTLLPRVMAAVDAAGVAPWYSRAWVTWPRGLQAASAVAFALIAAAAWMWWPVGREWMSTVLAQAEGPSLRDSSMLPSWAAQAATLSRVMWQVFFQPVAFYFAAIAVAGSLICAAFWSSVNRLALGGASFR